LRYAFDHSQLIPAAEPGAVSGTAYWIRLTTIDQQAIFGDGVDLPLALNEMGYILAEEWNHLAQNYPDIQLEDWTVMPSSVQGIFLMPAHARDSQGRFPALTKGQPPRQLSAFVASFKAASATRINLFRNHSRDIIWQRGYQQQCLKDQHILQQARQRLMVAL
jgi:hypothetical protein